MQWFTQLLGQESIPSATAGQYKVGEVVEYDSASQRAWILARVVALRDDGLVDLDCKPAVPLSKVRPAQGGASAAAQQPLGTNAQTLPPGGAAGQFAPGTVVEYNSASQGWILARVLSYDPASGTYNLDCKQQVPPAKLRASSQAGTMPSQSGNLNGVGTVAYAPPSRQDVAGSQQNMNAAGAVAVPSYAQLPPPSRQDLPKGAAVPSPGAVHQEEPMQLVGVTRDGDKWKFKVNDDAAKILESYGQRRVAVATICGPYRTGKSYLLNLLLGRIQRGEKLFSVGNTTQACTQGLWMWGSTAGPEGSTMLYLDCEGFGSTDSDRTRDCKLMSLCMLLSSIFVLNTKGVLNEGLFNALSLVCHLAEHMEEKGHETSKPALIWCLRDFILQLEDESGKPISSDEYLEQALRAKPLAGVDAERSRAAREVRESLLKFFDQRNCVTFVQPTIDEEKLRSLPTVPYTDLRNDFRKQLETLQDKLQKDAAIRPKTVAGQVVGGAALAALLRKLVDALNSNQALNVMSAWEQVQHTACGSLLEDLRKQGVEKYESFIAGGPLPVPGSPTLPVRDDVLSKALAAVRAELYEEWKSRAVGEEDTRREYWAELCDSMQGDEQAVERKNAKLAEDQLREGLAAWEAWLAAADGEASANDPRAEMLANLLERGLPAQPTARVAHDALNAAKNARLKWDGRLSAVKAELELKASQLSSAPPPQASAGVDDGHLEQTRELGRLQGQVSALESQVKQAQDREAKARQRIPEIEEALRLEQRTTEEAKAEASKHAQTVEELQAKIKELESQPPPEPVKEKKCCVVM
mmetsp:Transcript_26207/g.61157  ORF Transcript_26207/g.61157 Transcript_26207/m.61157 type:complete len:809 (+) Transcript_26207:110-2536(+)|eukprot:CAMPEP_0178443678 /NCGR_PEP_ID=MMETSP0689_2-20121128/39040_1 /TAXON_ID=160604 /ORGANISM="Amphidinium massartii, Strain CS-259" /LENGTH=808 /DNA_ID=CAMNT_0020067735 /DNA_START=59 /DNA_END=2485 /DNA_ORIENTATION=+